MFPNFPPPATPRAASVLSLAVREFDWEGGEGAWPPCGARARGREPAGRRGGAGAPAAGRAPVRAGSPGTRSAEQRGVPSRRREAPDSALRPRPQGGGRCGELGPSSVGGDPQRWWQEQEGRTRRHLGLGCPVLHRRLGARAAAARSPAACVRWLRARGLGRRLPAGPAFQRRTSPD